MNPKTRRQLVLLAIVGVLLLIGVFLLNNSLLTISSSSDKEMAVYIKKSDNVQNFSIKKGSKTLLLPRGSYQIEANSPDGTSYYQKDLGVFWSHKIDIELKQQQASTYLGRNELRCAKDQTGTAVFYSCNPGASGVIAGQNSGPGIADSTANFSTVLKPYKDVFIEARTANGSISLQQKNNEGAAVGQKLIQKYSGKISDSTFSVGKAGEMAILDKATKSILIFKDAQDQNPVKVSIDAQKIEENDYGLSLHAAGAYTFLINAPGGDHTEGEDHTSDGPKKNPKIFVVNNQTSDIGEQDIPKDWIISATYGGPDGSVLLLLSGNQQGQVYRYSVEEGLKRLPAVKDTVQSLCWKDADTFYYRADASQTIFEYSNDQKASFLVYSNPVNFIDEISCVEDKVYFAISNDKSDDPSKLSHYMLLNRPLAGTRLDTLLPMYYTFNRDTLRFMESRGGVTIALDYDSDGNGPPLKETARQELLKILQDKGVDTTSVAIDFAY